MNICPLPCTALPYAQPTGRCQNICMYIYVYIYIHTLHMHTHTHTCVCVYVYRWRPWLGDPNAAEFAHGGTEADGYSEAAQAGMQFVSCVCGGVYVCVCVHTYIHAYVHTCIQSVFAYVCICIHMYVYTYV